MAAVRRALLKHVRVNATPLPLPLLLLRYPKTTPNVIFNITFNAIRRFSDEVMGSFLDKSEVTDRVVSVVKNFQKVDPSKVTPNAHFQKDLGLDSLDTVEVVMALEEEFGFEIPDNEADKISTINQAVEFIASHPQAK
ncbi:acyl carrier protein 2, mitochondrial-like [Hibiscus syriacus]|uniref:acyl carrier protein 2, mitochondrial-like n=1 Tax=Hibiscus syriacus TaxID=106335 RepID=UPI0019247928|nr:acyl carrier protein 2, mitochondrial-like [Hibiscus syriacus]XP_039057276.1 acyl carrier protein 2, mitochondrial-like [Hibiscus syriacus]